MSVPLNVIDLAADLIRHPSVSPDPGGSQIALGETLSAMGFTVTHLPFGEGDERTPNLFARLGAGGPHLCFAGHTDVVPPGSDDWTHGPYAGDVAGGRLYGRGACDMKGGIAAFVAAVSAFLARRPEPRGSISLLITGDEEGPAHFGTQKVLEWMRRNHEIPDFCVVGEPTNPAVMGEVIKIGRRGSINVHLTVHGRQGHVAYPHRADNPVHRLLRILSALTAEPLDEGSEWFEPSSLQVTGIDVGNPATNVIPARATAALNIRFNNLHTGGALRGWIETICQRYAPGTVVEAHISGESFLTKPGPEVAALADAVRTATGREPRLDTGGGTSDARFIALYCPVAEFGLVGTSMHQIDEHVAVDDLECLTRVYEDLLERMVA
ncbi:succinyl-diaminopimelate desuccinylase [Acetobacter oeni]|uniref:Succinyl-diaminopimelate desuccinylase n=1 Tax=Acetobacter oeni TaxID=304077 RepID=A0A511XM53_9PROT|nr:succinyl-diaminopimelate desuccinylase [Acetobacter oeni]MBB3884035.1 succinyl-diaminopimelate desuccinylase [Acetobacter oeni]NHO20018.1 succinyl-diaminopimelate desuccinylase [Acetobacter oeni]GBR04562.1 succinyl-diaminopimelate desuccinylase [Acetobacter oeni LMG 21952]GEN64022.1 succinyl-diaminopimelate desuccinylase [Acetobacter oeni]